ncbi:alpha/beta fold hydrolase [Methylobacterium sp. Leaf99]|uniref:alpha/beta fold hydrolase n=1 Tax=Methylobacterium sp. Leaf99 TaxID=1736251 RepID=UPI000ABFA255|nr:alpha/beta fold hydrolase [Methylobacterium sp. Leaf99]
MSEQQVKTTLLDVNVHVAGPADGPTVLLLHGWPDDATTWATVAGHLNEAGFRTVTPELRGFGGTRFRSADTPRTGNRAVHHDPAADIGMDARPRVVGDPRHRRGPAPDAGRRRGHNRAPASRP